ncbi:DUF551 domain-containing protein [Serratia marcescens]|nr:DUF551 domain-containing protein [Serratia marcescens]
MLTAEQYTEGLCGDGAAILCNGVPMSVSEILAALNAANREAQPVGLVDRRQAASGGICWQNDGKDLPHGTELFTAPPAPAVLAQPVSGGYKLADGWIACSERMPKDGDVVLVFQEGGIIFCAEVDDGEFYPDEFPRVPTQGREITYWMPLPTPPEVRRVDA